MNNYLGRWWIADESLKNEKYFGELIFNEADVGELKIYTKINSISQQFMDFLENNKKYTIHGETNNNLFTCLNCYTNTSFIPVIDQEDIYSKKTVPLIDTEVSILVNCIVDGLQINNENEHLIKKMLFKTHLITEWMDLIKPNLIKNKEFPNHNIYSFDSKPIEKKYFLDNQQTTITFSNWWKKDFNIKPKREVHFTSESDLVLSTDKKYSLNQLTEIFIVINNLICFCLEKTLVTNNRFILDNSDDFIKYEIKYKKSNLSCRKEFWRTKQILFNNICDFQTVLSTWNNNYPKIKLATNLYLSSQREKQNIISVFINFIISFERFHKAFYNKIKKENHESELKIRIKNTLEKNKNIFSATNIFNNIYTDLNYEDCIESFSDKIKNKRNAYAHGDSNFWEDDFSFYQYSLAMKTLCKLEILKNIFNFNDDEIIKYL